jgi:hypothetical protein
MRAFFLIVCLIAPSWADQEHRHELTDQEIGSVHFVTSCAKPGESQFNHAVALLHSFQYEQARQAFSELASREPDCAMASWGVAMTQYHGLWGNGDMAAGRTAIQQARAAAQANGRTSAREKQYIEALSEIYAADDRDQPAHALAFEQKMAALQAAYPDDIEAAIFHALTLSITAPKTDKTFSNQKKCGEILEPILDKLPDHPGVAHYLIHCYDNPVLAESGLKAARTYARIAPASAHANHMPSHIFTRVGSWQESIDSNRRSAELAAAAEAESRNGEARDQRLHAMDYLEYAYLQSGQMKQAQSVLDQMNSLSPVSGLTLTGDYALAATPARRAIEAGDWATAVKLNVRRDGVPWARAISWFAIGIASAQLQDSARAAQAEQTLAALRDEAARMGDKYWSNQIEVQRREVSACMQEQASTISGAIMTMRSAADLEESMDKHAVTPGAVVPARELLAQLLARVNRPRDALAEYQAVLKVAPNRFNAVYGAAQAAAGSDDAGAAQQYFRRLTEIAISDERPEVLKARKALATTAMK